jgi:hypothetical protein
MTKARLDNSETARPRAVTTRSPSHRDPHRYLPARH